MADGTPERMSRSRVDESGGAPARAIKREGRWPTLTWAEGVWARLGLSPPSWAPAGSFPSTCVMLTRLTPEAVKVPHARPEAWTAVPWDRFESLLSTVILAA